MQKTSSAGPSISRLLPLGYQSGDCGYCKSEDSGASYYVSANSLSPEHYQLLMDRGWRRSGTLLYLPDASRSCCPHYTIRLPASQFQASRDQRQTLYRWNRFVLGEQHIKQADARKPKGKNGKKQNNASFDLATTVHESEEQHVDPDVEPRPDHRLTVTLEPADYTDEKYDLFANYQQHVHHEGPAEVTKSGFKRFLCASPIQRKTDASGKVLGSHHHCYRLDGRLIAMSVLDLLPHAVSGVYFVYHQDFEKWSLGKLSALREAALALEGGYEYYYMGYYIHSCAKMHYKGTYKPQYVLDFESFGWDPLDDNMRALMEKRKYVSMSRERTLPAVQDASATSAPDTTAGAATVDVESNGLRDPYPLPPHPVPLEAGNSGLSLLELGMPGVLTLSELRSQIDLGQIKITLGRGGVHHMEDIVSWESGTETSPTTLKGVIAEMAACLGPELSKGIVVDMSRV